MSHFWAGPGRKTEYHVHAKGEHAVTFNKSGIEPTPSFEGREARMFTALWLRWNHFLNDNTSALHTLVTGPFVLWSAPETLLQPKTTSWTISPRRQSKAIITFWKYVPSGGTVLSERCAVTWWQCNTTTEFFSLLCINKQLL